MKPRSLLVFAAAVLAVVARATYPLWERGDDDFAEISLVTTFGGVVLAPGTVAATRGRARTFAVVALAVLLLTAVLWIDSILDILETT